jgi:AcrR family transcriptional regulator
VTTEAAEPSVEPRRRGPRGPYAAGREAQLAIVEAARAVFAERGYRAGSLRDVGERAGVSAANVIHHFGSKEGLLVAVLEARDLGSGPDLLEHFRRGEIVPALRGLVGTNAANRDLVQLFVMLSAEATDPTHPANEYFRRRYTNIRAYVTAAVERGRETGALPAGPDPSLVATGLIAVMDGLQKQWLLDDAFDMTAAFDAHLLAIGARLERES